MRTLRDYPGHRLRRPPVEHVPGPGELVTVEPVWPAVVAHVVEGRPVPAKEATIDGFEGPGVIEAVEGSYARVRLDDGRVIVGVKRSRLTRRTP